MLTQLLYKHIFNNRGKKGGGEITSVILHYQKSGDALGDKKQFKSRLPKGGDYHPQTVFFFPGSTKTQNKETLGI